MNEECYKDLGMAVEKRVDDLLGRMTMNEKLGQLSQLFSGYTFTTVEQYDEKARKGEIGSFVWGQALPKERNRIQRIAVEESRLGIPIIFGWDIIHGHRI